MVLKKPVKKNHSDCQRILSKLKGLISKWYRKLPNPFTCSTRNRKQDYLFYDVLGALAESDQDSVMGVMEKQRLLSPRELLKEEDVDAYNGSFINFLKGSPLRIVKNQEPSPRRETKSASIQNAWQLQDPYSKQPRCAGFQLEQKMRALEMMDTEDLDHVLDIEEVLHYYSRLKTPVYIEMVDKFFTHVCSDIYSPQSSSVTDFYERGGQSVSLRSDLP